MSEVWQVQVRKDGEPILGFLRQGDGDQAAVETAVREAREWGRENANADNLTIFVTVDPDEFVRADP